MKCIPKYTVSYHGVFYKTGESFDIDAKDAVEMRKHGTIENSADTAFELPVRRPGRPKKIG